MSTGDKVIIIIVLGALAIGLLSMFVGWAARMWDQSVNRSQSLLSTEKAVIEADDTDRLADRPSVSAVDPWVVRLEVDRSKVALIELLVYSGWQVGEIRAVIKGDNGAIGVEVDAARQRLGLDPPERTLRVKDERGERVIPI